MKNNITKPQLQKKALSLGLPKSLSKLSILFGFSSSYLTDIFNKKKELDKRVYVIFNLHEKLFNATQKIDTLEAKLKDCPKTGTYQGDTFLYSITSDHQSDLKQFGENEILEPTENKLYSTALDAVVTAFKFDYSSITNLLLERIDTKKEQEQLNKDLLFL